MSGSARMGARAELTVVVLGLLALQLLTSFAAIGLFDRMSPAIAHIVERDGSAPSAEDQLAQMRRRDAEARRLVNAGAWAIVTLGAASVLVAIFLLRRIERRVFAPLVELDRATRAAAEGDAFRRCRLDEAPLEIVHTANAINELLDRRVEAEAALDVRGDRDISARVDRRALLMLLDRDPRPCALVDADGGLLATNRPADALFDRQIGLRGALAAAGGEHARVVESCSLDEAGALLVWLSEDRVQDEGGDGEVDAQAEHVAERGDERVARDGGVEAHAPDEQGQDGSEGGPEGDHA